MAWPSHPPDPERTDRAEQRRKHEEDAKRQRPPIAAGPPENPEARDREDVRGCVRAAARYSWSNSNPGAPKTRLHGVVWTIAP